MSEKKCYFCGRTESECNEIYKKFIDDNILLLTQAPEFKQFCVELKNGESSLPKETKDKIHKELETRLCTATITDIAIGSVGLQTGYGKLDITIPCCSICREMFKEASNAAFDRNNDY